MKNSNQKSVSETVCCVDNSEVVSESSAAREVFAKASLVMIFKLAQSGPKAGESCEVISTSRN